MVVDGHSGTVDARSLFKKSTPAVRAAGSTRLSVLPWTHLRSNFLPVMHRLPVPMALLQSPVRTLLHFEAGLLSSIHTYRWLR
jgi:hypothetical protein